MKLTLIGHDDRYAVEQLQMSLFGPDFSGKTLSSLHRGKVWLTATTAITLDGKTVRASRRLKVSEETVRDRRRILQQSLYLAAIQLLPELPPWGALAGAFLAPFLYGLYWKGTTKAGVVASFFFGVAMEIFQLIVSLGWINVTNVPVLNFIFQNSLYSGVIAMVGGLVLVPLVSLLTKKTLPEKLDEKFACYDQTKTVEVTDSLGA